jgi:hypothetical protein
MGELDRQALREDRIKGKLRKWKADHATLLQKFDRNRDGQIDLDEWEAVRQTTSQEVRREELQEDQQPIHTLSDTQSSSRPLLISSKEEFEIVRHMRRVSIGALLGFFLLGSLTVWMITIRLI